MQKKCEECVGNPVIYELTEVRWWVFHCVLLDANDTLTSTIIVNHLSCSVSYSDHMPFVVLHCNDQLDSYFTFV